MSDNTVRLFPDFLGKSAVCTKNGIKPSCNLIDKKQNELKHNTLYSLANGSETNCHLSTQTDKRVDFLLCPSCFWCASYLNFGELSIISCPVCHNNHIDQLPVSIDKA